MKALVASLLAWIVAETGLVMPPPPRVVFASAEQLQQRVPGRTVALAAVYERDTATVYLRDDWDRSSVANRAALLHELVHHVQEFNRVPVRCRAARERQAYELTLKWLAERGVRDPYALLGVDEFTIDVLSLCPPE